MGQEQAKRTLICIVLLLSLGYYILLDREGNRLNSRDGRRPSPSVAFGWRSQSDTFVHHTILEIPAILLLEIQAVHSTLAFGCVPSLDGC